jgi:SAM-dependent methyltransferase
MRNGWIVARTRRRIERFLPASLVFLARTLVRERRVVPPPGWVRFGSLRRTAPISRMWGYDRGTPIDRFYIERILERYQEDIRGRVLEVGNDRYARQFGGGRVTQCDVLDFRDDNPHATIVCDLATGEALPSNAFDCVILTQVLQFVYPVEEAVQTVHRILKPGGTVLVTVPGISQVVDEVIFDRWYWSFTPASMQGLFAGAFGESHVQVASLGNVLSAVGLLHGLAVTELRERDLRVRDPAYNVIVALRAVKRLET